MANVSLHPAAQREYQAALGWYQQRSQTAARRFVTGVDRLLANIGAQPERYEWYDDQFREAVLRRSPYSIVSRIEPSGDVLIVAIAHASREPGYWEVRTEPTVAAGGGLDGRGKERFISCRGPVCPEERKGVRSRTHTLSPR